MPHTQQMRRLIQLVEDVPVMNQATGLPPEIAKYIAQYPETVADDPQTLIAQLGRHAETGARFRWTIAQLPDGRYLESPSERFAKQWGLPIVRQGTDDDL